jgi:hypothetical protein
LLSSLIPGSDLEKYEAPEEDPPMNPMLPYDDEALTSATNSKTNPTTGRTAVYWIILALVMLFLLFFTGSIFSCRAFSSVYQEDFDYGYRGVMNNVTGECISWEEYNDTGGGYRLLLICMGIAGIILCVIALGIWILEGTYGIRTAIKNDISTEADTSPTRPSQRSCCVCLVIPMIFGIVLGVFGVSAFITLMGNCSNIIRLDPGGLACNFSVWSSLGMFASIAACILGSSVCCVYRRSSR